MSSYLTNCYVTVFSKPATDARTRIQIPSNIWIQRIGEKLAYRSCVSKQKQIPHFSNLNKIINKIKKYNKIIIVITIITVALLVIIRGYIII